MGAHLKKIARLAAGIILIVLGIIGAILPIIPGFVFLIPGLLILSEFFPPVKRLVTWVRNKVEERQKARRSPTPGSPPHANSCSSVSRE